MQTTSDACFIVSSLTESLRAFFGLQCCAERTLHQFLTCMDITLTKREIDRLVAERVMGWTNLYLEGSRFGTTPEGKSHRIVPQYSSDMSAAWEVVERLRHSGYEGGIDWTRPELGYECAFWSSPIPPDEMQPSRAETAPLAICLAALRGMGVSI